MTTIATVRESDLTELLALLRGYCDFYEVAPDDDALLAVSRALVADPAREGVQFIAREETGAAVGFATVYWSWQTLAAARLGVMNDLFVAPDARGRGVAESLIAACRDASRAHGATTLSWQTALDNARAQVVYDRVGARRSQWLDYSLGVEDGGAQ